MDKEEKNTEVIEEKKAATVEKKKKKEHHKNNEEIKHLKEELAAQNEKILRLSAEMQNMRRRSDEERSRLLKYDGETVIVSMLTILDNFAYRPDRETIGSNSVDETSV